jgi:hypothetical protein
MHKALRRAVTLTAIPALTVATAAMLALPASAATAKVKKIKPGTVGPTLYSATEAGYAATQNSFRFVKADYTLPDPTQFKPYVSRVEYTSEFWSPGRVTVLGVYASTSDTSATPWHVEAKAYNAKTHALLCATWSKARPCGGVTKGSDWAGGYKTGDIMQVTTLFSQGSGTVHFNMVDLTANVTSNASLNAGKAIFGQARLATEFGCSPWAGCNGKPVTVTEPSSPLLVMQANDSELSVMPHGLIGFAGPFAHNQVVMTSNGKSGGKVLAHPENLSQNLNGYHSDYPEGEFDVALP